MSDSHVVQAKLPCPHCTSSDAYHVYSDGHGHCFSCGSTDKRAPTADAVEAGDTLTPKAPPPGRLRMNAEYRPLDKRGIDRETCEKFSYSVGDYKGKTCHIAPYYKDGVVVAEHVRLPGKEFLWHGESKGVELFGQHLWRDGGKMLVITEGEIDCLTVSQLQGNKWPVVSLPNGAQSARKSVAANLEWVEKFEKVVLMFDMDEPGRHATHEVAQLLSPGKAYIAALPLKDANDMLKAGRGKEVIDAIWGAKQWRPDGVVSLADLIEDVCKPTPKGIPYPFAGLNTLLHGIFEGTVVTITAGTGIGKSAFCRELAYHLAFVEKQTGGYVALEENVKRTARGFLGIYLNKPVHLPGVDVPEADIRAAFAATLGTGRLYAYDHFGSLDPDVLLGRLRYMVKSLGCKWIVLDHLSILVSGLEIEDERKAIDVMMTKLRSFAEETGAAIFVVSHLRRMQGNGAHETGHEVSLSHLRGSQAIAQLSDAVIALERDQQADDEEERNTTNVRVLKNRLSGETGLCGSLHYSRTTGRLTEEQVDFGAETL